MYTMMKSRYYLTEISREKTFPAPVWNPRPSDPHLLHCSHHLPYRFLCLLQRTRHGQALTGSQYSEVPRSDCYCQYLGRQQTNPDPVYPIRVAAIYLIDWQVPAMVQSHVRLWDVTFNSHLKLIGFCFQWQNAWWPFQCCQPCIHLLAWVSNQRFCWRHHHLSQQLKNFEGQWKFFQGGKTVSDQLDWSKFGFLLLMWRIQIDLFA